MASYLRCIACFWTKAQVCREETMKEIFTKGRVQAWSRLFSNFMPGISLIKTSLTELHFSMLRLHVGIASKNIFLLFLFSFELQVEDFPYWIPVVIRFTNKKLILSYTETSEEPSWTHCLVNLIFIFKQYECSNGLESVGILDIYLIWYWFVSQLSGTRMTK